MKSKVPLVINVSNLTNCGVAATPASKAVEKQLRRYKFRDIPLKCNPLEMRTMEEFGPVMDKFFAEAFSASNHSRMKIRTDFITPLMHVIGSNLTKSYDTSEITGPYVIRLSTRKHMNRQENISKTSYILAQFLRRYRVSLFLWRETKNLLVWPGVESTNELSYSAICFAARAAIPGDERLAPIFHAQNFIVSNFASIYNCIRENFMETALPDGRIPMLDRCSPTSNKMSENEVLWHCLCQIVGTFCPTHSCTCVEDGSDYNLIDYPDEDIDISEILKDLMG